MPEGDTIHYAANRIRPVLLGEIPVVETPHPRFRHDKWPERLAGREVVAIEAHGKHLFLRFAGDLTLHSHLRAKGFAVVQFDGPVLELMTESRARFDRRLAALGPDVIGAEFDTRRFLRRLSEDDPTRPIGDTLLDQRIVAGLGTVWRSEACWHARLDPHRPAGEVPRAQVLDGVLAVRPLMTESARTGNQNRAKRVYGFDGRPCPRCGTLIRGDTLGDDNRPSYWCPGCQT